MRTKRKARKRFLDFLAVPSNNLEPPGAISRLQQPSKHRPIYEKLRKIAANFKKI